MSSIFNRSLQSNFENWRDRLPIPGLPSGVTCVGLMNQVMFRSSPTDRNMVEVNMSRTRTSANMTKVCDIPATQYSRLTSVGNQMSDFASHGVSLARYLVFKELGLLSAIVNNYQRA